MRDKTLLFVVVIGILIFSFIFCRSRPPSVDNYEISDLAFDVCQEKCYDLGHSHSMCSDENKLSDCIKSMIEGIDKPPPETALAPI